MNIYVGNIAFGTTENDLRLGFGAYGTVTQVNIIRTGQSLGFGFVEMLKELEAENAIAGLNGSGVCGCPLFVSEARPP
jgi:RNA recognition motif-containing protein